MTIIIYAFEGMDTLNMFNCNQNTIIDIPFKYLKGIHTLNMLRYK